MIHLNLHPLVLKIGFDPIFLQQGGLQLGWHGFFTAAAVIVAVVYALRRAQGKGLPGGPVGDVAVWAVVGGIIGARVFHVFDHVSYFAAHPLAIFEVWQGGIAVYGAFIGGIVGGYVAARRAHLPIWGLLDVAAPAMLVGQMIGRLGCLSNGDAWGEPTSGSWGVVYTNPHDLLPASLLGVPTHPYPLYEIAAVALLLGALWLGRAQLRVPGSLFLFAALGYSVIRFGLTFFRQEPVMFWGLQEAQVIALFAGVAVLALMVGRWLGYLPLSQASAKA